MPYDPNYPVDGSQIKAVEFRNQFHGLKTLHFVNGLFTGAS